jgi:RNA polymerase sigma-70 factor (ECF subfamily)
MTEIGQSLESLMRKAQGGDKASYARLLVLIQPLIKGFVYNRLGRISEADDVLQEVLLAIHKASHTYNTERSFKAWMFAIADYKVKDYLRAHYRKAAHTMVDFADMENILFEDVTETRDVGEVLTEVLAVLPEKQRKIVHMMKVEGYSVEQVAQSMNMSASAVKVSAHRAYKVLMKKKDELQ